MDTIEEQSKSEAMSVSPTPSPKNLRICLVGNVAGDTETLEAAKSFGVPVVTSETGLDMVSDSGWTTYFIMNDFESPAFETIHKSEHRIMGPPALQQTAKSGDGLKHSSRPVYNYSMRGVITCFTGIRKKDELTRLVNLIHSMGGSIRKDMNSKVTHLICNTSGGEKYQYAMTFRLAVVRSDWVYKAWENRDVHNFAAINEEFTKDHRLKAFEGQRICFFGFALDEHQHMVDVLKNNGGIPTELDDPECSHVIMANTGGHFPENIPSSRNSSQINSDDQDEHDKNHKSGLSDDSEKVDSPKTPLSSRIPVEDELVDGIVLTSNDENDFLNPNNLSPILSNNAEIGESQTNTDMITPIDEEDEEDAYNDDVAVKEMKRKRDSFDNVSLMSTDSIAIGSTSSAKKPKLLRTGSITRSIKRSMSFVGIRTPISNILRPRRNSVDPNASVSSITSVDITLNESIKKPVKEKIRSLRDRITRSTKRDINITPKAAKLASSNLSNLSKICKIKASDKCETPERPAAGSDQVTDLTDFKTPLLPKSNHSLTSSSTSTHRHSVSGIGSISSNLIDEARYSVNMPPVRKSYAADTSITQSIFAATGSRDFAIMNRNDPSANVATMNECDISICPTIVENHPVVDEHFTQAKPEPKNNKTHIVKSDWFWYTIQNGYADEADYLFGDYLDSIANTPGTDRRDSLPISFNKRKRKRFSQRIQTEGTPLGSGKRRSSVSDAGLLSVSGSFLDCTASPDKHDPAGGNNKVIPENDVVVEATPKNKSMRYNHFMDFYHTESNYVGILDTIVNLFKIPLEEKAETSDALLNKSEVRAIFSNFLPIHEVHRHMLERLKELQTKWSEECLIGQIILDHRDDLMKAYPPYVNFFEQMKETLILCDTQNPRFHAFLKINQAKPECGRQSLQDLMIRPVQRLPSISLLLNDILKHTNKNNPDNKKLEEALRSIKDVMAHINEDKRKTEGQLAMFDIFNDIDGCPAHLVSSHRQFVSKCEVTEVTDALSGRGNSLMLYLFTDTIEVCKKRSKGFNSGKSPSATKPFKHIKLMPLNTIKLVIDIKDSPRAFAVTCRHNHDNKEKLYAFIMCDDEIDKIIYLRSLCKQMAENACRTDTEKSLLQLSSSEVGVDTSDVNIGTLSKAFKFATQTRLKVTRAFSFNKTPSKLKRAVSTMMTSPFGSTNSLTPASQFSQMKLASCTNINEVGEEDNNSEDSPSSQSEILIAPMSVQPTRKAKNATISMAALRRI